MSWFFACIAWLTIRWTSGLYAPVDVCALDTLFGLAGSPIVVVFGCWVVHSAHWFRAGHVFCLALCIFHAEGCVEQIF